MRNEKNKALKDAYFIALSNSFYMVDGAKELLDKLVDKYTLCAVSNGAKQTQINRIKGSGIGKYFKGGIFISEEMGSQKPKKEYFDFVFNKLGNPPKEEILLFGDSISSDIMGAQNAGIDCCFVNIRNNEYPDDLKKPTYTIAKLDEIIKTCNL